MMKFKNVMNRTIKQGPVADMFTISIIDYVYNKNNDYKILNNYYL